MAQFERSENAAEFIKNVTSNANVFYIEAAREHGEELRQPAYDDRMNNSEATVALEKMRADMAEHRADIRELISQNREEFVELKAELKSGLADVRAALSTQSETNKREVHEMNANISRWMLQTTLAVIGTIVLGFAGLFFNFSRTIEKPAATPAQPVFIIPQAQNAPASPPPPLKTEPSSTKNESSPNN